MKKIIAGVDEAGRGPLAGPVYAAAVILNPKKPIAGLTDSKLLTAKNRELLFQQIQERALCWAIASADIDEIDDINILQASLLAMQRAVNQLTIAPEIVYVDGNIKPKLNYETEAIIKGDLLIPAISAASILAKVARDRVMIEFDQHYPQYGFAQHKGYATELHLNAIHTYGPCAIHRKSFAPVKFQK